MIAPAFVPLASLRVIAPPSRSVGDGPPLRDQFGRTNDYLRISLTDRCNLRCVYCMPAEGLVWQPRAEQLTTDEILRIARVAVGVGVTKIRLTGGEPTVFPELDRLIAGLGALRPLGLRTLAMTSNGLNLPLDRLRTLKTLGLDRLNLSLDTLRPDRFAKLTRRDSWSKAWAALEGALAAGYAPVKLNCVVLRGENDDELIDFVRLTERLPIDVRFIELMPFPGNGWSASLLLSAAEMVERIRVAFPDFAPVAEADPNASARPWAVPGFAGRVAVISSMTDDFCDSCNRIRLTADGRLKSCLFDGGETAVRESLRSGATDADLVDLFRAAVHRKQARHGGTDELLAAPNRPMIQIGG